MPSVTNPMRLMPREAQTLIQDHTEKAPYTPILNVEPILRNCSPLFLNEPPYQDDDSFLDKCLKSISAALGLIHYARSDVRTLLEFHPVAAQIQSHVKEKSDEIAGEMCKMYLSFLDSMFAFEYYSEKLDVLKGNKSEIPKNELIEKFLGSFKEVLGARSSIFIDGKRVSIKDKAFRQTLLDERKTYLDNLYNQLEKVSGNTLEEAELGVQVFKELYELQHTLQIELNYVLVSVLDIVESPLQTLS